MQEHPVPQNVTGYEFHLIGQMTLKQFMEVAAGIVVAVIINTTNLPSFVKYPLMIIAGLMGAALAFIPLEGRPLDRWFFAFIKSIYQPTMFFWKKTNSTPPVFTYTQPQGIDSSPKVDYTPIKQARVREFMHTVAPATPSPISDEESAAANAVLGLFSSPDLPKISSAPLSSISPRPQVVLPNSAQVPPAGAPANTDYIGHIIEMKIETQPSTAPTAPAVTTPSSLPSPGGVIQDSQAAIGYADKNGVTQEHVPAPAAPVATQVYNATLQSVPTQTQAESKPRETIVKPAPAITGIPFPNKPTQPNVIAGMVMNLGGKIIDGAIVTILREMDRNPVRAMKTNTLGQFAIVTALDPGSYLITVEKDGYSFDNYSLAVNNTVIEPVLLKANQ